MPEFQKEWDQTTYKSHRTPLHPGCPSIVPNYRRERDSTAYAQNDPICWSNSEGGQGSLTTAPDTSVNPKVPSREEITRVKRGQAHTIWYILLKYFVKRWKEDFCKWNVIKRANKWMLFQPDGFYYGTKMMQREMRWAEPRAPLHRYGLKAKGHIAEQGMTGFCLCLLEILMTPFYEEDSWHSLKWCHPPFFPLWDTAVSDLLCCIFNYLKEQTL